jgi:hypothetical protein
MPSWCHMLYQDNHNLLSLKHNIFNSSRSGTIQQDCSGYIDAILEQNDFMYPQDFCTASTAKLMPMSNL